MTTVSFFDLHPIYGDKTLYLGVPRWYYPDLKKHFNIIVDDNLKYWNHVSRSDGKWVNGQWTETWKHDDMKSTDDNNIVFVRTDIYNIDRQATQSSWETHQRDFGLQRSYFLYYSESDYSESDDDGTQYLMFVFQHPGDEGWFKLTDEDSGYKVTQHPMIIPCSLHGCFLQSKWSLNLERIDLD